MFYDYKVTPAPRRVKRVRGVGSTAELFSATLAEAINAAAREGWEYVRAESLPAEEAGGWFRRATEGIETVLIYRRPRESLGPRLSAARAEEETDGPRLGPVERGDARVPERADPWPADRAPERVTDRTQGPALRREPRVSEPAEPSNPLRPGPRLGPADRA